MTRYLLSVQICRIEKGATAVMIGSALSWVNAAEVYTPKLRPNAILDARIFAAWNSKKIK